MVTAKLSLKSKKYYKQFTYSNKEKKDIKTKIILISIQTIHFSFVVSETIPPGHK